MPVRDSRTVLFVVCCFDTAVRTAKRNDVTLKCLLRTVSHLRPFCQYAGLDETDMEILFAKKPRTPVARSARSARKLASDQPSQIASHGLQETESSTTSLSMSTVADSEPVPDTRQARFPSELVRCVRERVRKRRRCRSSHSRAECSNTVDSEGETSRVGGEFYHFCCPSCQSRFEERHQRLEEGM